MDLERLSYTVVEGISAIGMGRFQYMLLAYVGVGALGKAMELMCMTYVGLAAQHNLELSITDQNIIFVFTYIAMVVEALIWGFVRTVCNFDLPNFQSYGYRSIDMGFCCGPLGKKMDLERLSYTVDDGISAVGMGSIPLGALCKLLIGVLMMDLERLSYTVDEGISAIGIGRFQYTLLAYAGVGALGKAMELMCMSYVGLAAQHDLEHSITHQNIIFVFTCIAMVLGALIWGFVVDR
uniref:Organic cation/carnitine transporter 7-like n=1 Tax=Tanacetum cinerariifolium TaxID=118510 RepID=A0A6L2M5B7_TANCI|nr:organic cation/carnitine transporter 7-like [Tanacetum cinerariifolium]